MDTNYTDTQKLLQAIKLDCGLNNESLPIFTIIPDGYSASDYRGRILQHIPCTYPGAHEQVFYGDLLNCWQHNLPFIGYIANSSDLVQELGNNWTLQSRSTFYLPLDISADDMDVGHDENFTHELDSIGLQLGIGLGHASQDLYAYLSQGEDIGDYIWHNEEGGYLLESCHITYVAPLLSSNTSNIGLTSGSFYLCLPITNTSVGGDKYDGYGPKYQYRAIPLNMGGESSGESSSSLATLRFTGAVSATYNGTSAVTVNIPAADTAISTTTINDYFD